MSSLDKNIAPRPRDSYFLEELMSDLSDGLMARGFGLSQVSDAEYRLLTPRSVDEGPVYREEIPAFSDYDFWASSGTIPGISYVKVLPTSEEGRVKYVDQESVESFAKSRHYLSKATLAGVMTKLMDWAPDFYALKPDPESDAVGLKLKTLPKIARIVEFSPKPDAMAESESRLTFNETEKRLFGQFYQAIKATRKV